MKAITRVLALLLVAIMMIGMFAGCKQTPPTTTGAPAGTTAGKDNTPTTVNKTNAHTLKVMVQNSIGGSYDMNKIDELEIWTYAKELMAAYGVTLELQVVEKDQYGTAVQTTLAGGLAEMPDLIFVEGGQLSESLTPACWLPCRTSWSTPTAPLLLPTRSTPCTWLVPLTTARTTGSVSTRKSFTTARAMAWAPALPPTSTSVRTG